MKENYKISKLIAQEISETISDEDKQILFEWLQEKPENSRTYLKIQKRLQKDQTEKYYNKNLINKDWLKVYSSINKKRSGFTTLYFVGRIAAAIIIVIGFSYLVFNIVNNITPNKEQYSETKIEAGKKKAILVLENGITIDLNKNSQKEITQKGAVISMDSKGLVYKIQDSIRKPILTETYNTMVIPRAGEYSFTFSDGTKVWINSNTKLKYPVKFIRKERVVYLEGEAYFEVKKDTSKPFKVRTFSGMEVEVLGTKFNIEAYKSNENIITTLLSGKVKVSKEKEMSILEPNQQAIFNRVNNKIVKKDVDAHRFIAWKDGKFLFENERLEDIMLKISRWYDVEVFYMNPQVKDFHFTGDMERYGDITTILRMIENSTDIKFRIKNKSIIISDK